MMWSAVVVVLVGFLNSCSAQEQTSVQESTLTFELDGISHRELRRVEGNIVTLIDTEDGFITVLDYDRDIFMAQNTTSKRCYFANLENIPISRDEEEPIFVKDVEDESELDESSEDAIVFRVAGTLPEKFVRAANDLEVMNKCSSQPAYWLAETRSNSRKRRAKCVESCPWLCYICLCWIKS